MEGPDARAQTGTPYSEGTKVEVTASSGVKRGLQQKNTTAGWILVLEYGEKEPIAILVGPGVTVKPVKVAKEATVYYWKQIAKVLGELDVATEDQGYRSRPSGSTLGRNHKPSESDFPSMSGKNLRLFANRLNKIDAREVDAFAVEATQAIAAFITQLAENRDCAIGEDLGYSFRNDLAGGIQNTRARQRKWKELLEAAYKRVDTARKNIKELYGIDADALKLPKLPE